MDRDPIFAICKANISISLVPIPSTHMQIDDLIIFESQSGEWPTPRLMSTLQHDTNTQTNLPANAHIPPIQFLESASFLL